jgi:hypothetical protein
MLERRLHLTLRVRQRYPELDAVQLRIVLSGRLLGMRDPAPGRHQVQLAWPDHLLAAQAVPVQHVAGDQPGDGLQPDVRVRRHPHPGHAVHRHRPVVIGEAPRADAPAVPEREQPPHGHVADMRLPGAGQAIIARASRRSPRRWASRS